MRWPRCIFFAQAGVPEAEPGADVLAEFEAGGGADGGGFPEDADGEAEAARMAARPLPPVREAPTTAPPAHAPAPIRPPAVPIAAPAPSCGAPETRPVAIPGPKIPRPNREIDASTSDIASARVGSRPCSAAINWLKKVAPMPMMTASTMTLMPEAITLPS